MRTIVSWLYRREYERLQILAALTGRTQTCDVSWSLWPLGRITLRLMVTK